MAEKKDKTKDNEKVYTIPLRDAWKGACKKRAKKCMYVIREFVKRHTKIETVKIGPELNHEIWNKGIKNPPRKVKVQVVPHEDAVWVELQGARLELETKEEKEKKKEAPEEKKEEAKETDKEEKETKKQVPAAEKKKETEPKKKAKAPSSKKEKETDEKQDPSKKLPPKAKLR